MADEQGPPRQPTTVQMQAPPDWAIALSEKVAQGFNSVNARLDTIETNVEIQGHTAQDLAKRMTNLEERAGKIEDRQASNSMRARSASQVDMTHDAAIAELKQKVDASLAILERLDKVAANPMVRRVAYAVGVALLAWLSAKGLVLR